MGEEDFHPHCSQKFFGTTNPPIFRLYVAGNGNVGKTSH